MGRKTAELAFNEIPQRIENLIDTLAPYGFEKEMAKYMRAKQLNRSVAAVFHVSKLHPWYEAICRYREVEKQFPMISDSETRSDLEKLASDAIQLEIVLNQTKIPERIKTQLLRNLVGIDSGRHALVEVLLAYHYWRSHAEVEWVNSHSKGAEFVVWGLPFEFSVECKHFGIDTGKSITRDIKTKLVDVVQSEVLPQDLSGHVLIELKKTFPKDPETLKIVRELLKQAVLSKEPNITLPNELGTILLTLRARTELLVTNPAQLAESIAPNSHHMIFSKSHESCVSPLIVSLRSQKRNVVFDKLKPILKNARKQIGSERPGVIFVHYEALEQGEIEKIRWNEAFTGFNYEFLSESENVAAVCYVAGPFSRTQSRDAIYHEALEFKNPSVQLPENWSFIHREDLRDSKIV